ncbi:hypothetical protein EHQ30_14590 [Leptospira brenneri]|uniref:Uncharacterized protein n=1 Tax=Leptospira brenneri TaxID=2023182 RepID=A0A5F1Z3H0_9LEPT|nr:hypothetical protein [Leptospira brenneri]TGK91444.1 hypothetical protein EHQ30_14590 [Leptospira brenneri]
MQSLYVWEIGRGAFRLRIHLMKFLLIFLLVLLPMGCKSQEETGSGSKACSGAWKIYQACLIINDNNSSFCRPQYDGIVVACGMM